MSVQIEETTEEIRPNPAQAYHDKIVEFMRISLMTGQHSDDWGRNEGASYIVGQVLGCMDELGIPGTEANIIYVTGVCMMEHVRVKLFERGIGATYQGWTFDLPWYLHDDGSVWPKLGVS
ncbi:MAG TPA: hypothetical protein VIY48_00175 [Candidatus Paceibacterota bacterium]